MPGYLWVSQVPPKLSCDSSTTKLFSGLCLVRWESPPTPEMPAPTIRTSKCSVRAAAGRLARVAVSGMGRLFLGWYAGPTVLREHDRRSQPPIVAIRNPPEDGHGPDPAA